MIYAIGAELAAALKAQAVPIPVVFGPEPTASVHAGNQRIVIEYPIGDRGDSIAPPLSVHRNPKMPLIRMTAVRVRIFAQSGAANASFFEHAREAEHVIDHVLAELHEIVKKRKTQIEFGAAGYVALADAAGSSVWNGAVYEINLAIGRGVYRRTWAGEAAREVVIGSDVELATLVKASMGPGPAGVPPVDAETVSGG